ncbi:MAG: metalloregulator ArsR/SmtB family transcription factor [Bacillota bacterium]|nr:metalloregulator ArsR/SmtB family transcription factor [Bacillota bacterium]
MNTIDFALIFKALSDSNRLKIAEMLSQNGELCACKILERFEITQPTLSYHMNILCECGLVKSRKEGRWEHYSLDENNLKSLQAFVNSWQVPDDLGGCSE